LLPRNQGAGTATRIGTQQATGRVVVWTDADMTYPNDRIPELVAQLDDIYDQVVGARRTEDGTYKLARVRPSGPSASWPRSSPTPTSPTSTRACGPSNAAWPSPI
jgi:glycosyltransferase involved in cell wall biosynthesis